MRGRQRRRRVRFVQHETYSGEGEGGEMVQEADGGDMGYEGNREDGESLQDGRRVLTVMNPDVEGSDSSQEEEEGGKGSVGTGPVAGESAPKENKSSDSLLSLKRFLDKQGVTLKTQQQLASN